MTPTGLDQSWGYADPAAAARAGIKAISMYLSWDASKNITPAKIKAYHKVGIASIFNWESQAGAPLKGAAQGRIDAAEAGRQATAIIKAVGYHPNNKLTIYLSCDTDVTRSQFAAIGAYYRAAKVVLADFGFGVGVYGEADLVTYLHAQGITDSEWQTYAWSGGVLSPDTDFYQYLNGQTLGGASVDFDKIIHPTTLGAWWPPGSQYDGGDELTMDAEVKAAFDAVNARLDAMPTKVMAAVWAKRFPTGKTADGKDVTMQAGSTLVTILSRSRVLTAEGGVLDRLAAIQASAADPKAFAQAVYARFLELIGAGK